MLAISVIAQSQPNTPPKTVAGIAVNYDEALVGTYTLPDPLTLQSGKKVKNTDVWMNKRRPEILKLFEDNQFGAAPPKTRALSFKCWRKAPRFLKAKPCASRLRSILQMIPAIIK